jgi:hypothetical protein
VREKVASKQLQVRFIGTKDQLADVFTKALEQKISLLMFLPKLWEHCHIKDSETV